MRPGGGSPEDLWRPRAQPRGFVAAAFGGLLGAMVCGILGGFAAGAVLDVGPGAEPEAFVGPLAFGLLGGMWAGCVLGAYLALRLCRSKEAGPTALWTGIVLLPAMILVWVGLDPVPLWALVVAVTAGAAVLGRAIALRSSPLRGSA